MTLNELHLLCWLFPKIKYLSLIKTGLTHTLFIVPSYNTVLYMQNNSQANHQRIAKTTISCTSSGYIYTAIKEEVYLQNMMSLQRRVQVHSQWAIPPHYRQVALSELATMYNRQYYIKCITYENYLLAS